MLQQNPDPVLKLAAGATAPAPLPFSSLSNDGAGFAVDTHGTLFVTDVGDHKVMKLAAGARSSTDLPFTVLSYANGVAVDSTGNVLRHR